MPDRKRADSSRPEYRIFETNRFVRDIERIPHGFRASIEAKLRAYVYPQLRQRPHFGPNIRELSNWRPDTWRYRSGSWRFFYEINEEEKTVYMTVAEHRSDAYRK